MAEASGPETARREKEEVLVVVLERCSMVDMLKKRLGLVEDVVPERLSCGGALLKNSAGGCSGGEEGPRVDRRVWKAVSHGVYRLW